MQIQPLHADVLVEDMFFGEVQTHSGLIIMDDDKNDRGIHPRWAKVYAVGPENRLGIEVGEWILIEHGRWTRSMKIDGVDTKIRRVDPTAILMKSTVDPEPNKQYFRGKD